MGRVRQGRDAEFQKWKPRFVEGQDTRWEILERAWVVGTRGLEFRCSVTWSVTLCQNLCPSDGSHTLARQDEELVIIMLIQALAEEFDNLTSALLLQKDINKAKVIEAFVTEENNCHHHTVEEMANRF